MSVRAPPKLAVWLLERCGSEFHAESLAGDLIEEYRSGRNRRSLWRQVATAIGLALLRSIRTMRWSVLPRASLWLVTETAAVLALTAIVNQIRRTAATGEIMSTWFIIFVATLIMIASLGAFASARNSMK